MIDHYHHRWSMIGSIRSSWWSMDTALLSFQKTPNFYLMFCGSKLELLDSRFPAVDWQLIFLKGVYLSVQSTLLMQKNLDVSDPCTLENLFFWVAKIHKTSFKKESSHDCRIYSHNFTFVLGGLDISEKSEAMYAVGYPPGWYKKIMQHVSMLCSPTPSVSSSSSWESFYYQIS